MVLEAEQFNKIEDIFHKKESGAEEVVKKGQE